MTALNLRSTVGEWVANQPHTSRVFEKLRVDYCCGGGKSLERACLDHQLDPQEVLTRLLEATAAGADHPAEDWNNQSLVDLANHIERTHHAYLKSELPRLTQLIAKVVNAHGQSHPELSEIQQTFARLRAELEPHMFKEEMVLFPAIRTLEQQADWPTFPFGTVANPIRMMEHEHDNAGEALAQIRTLTRDYIVPDNACNTYRAMLDGLECLERDMHQHVHKENNILFPKALEREQTMRIT
jgi:regulator of cell morphogenesis and NO signaling